MADARTSRDVRILLVIVFLLEMAMALYVQFAYGPSAPSYDAMTRTGVGLDLLGGESRGRQGFVG